MWNLSSTAELSPVCFGSCVKAPTQHLSVCVYRGVVVQSICPGLRSGLLQSAGSVSIEKAEPPWPIQQPPRALIQLKMNSLNLWRGKLQSCNWAKRDPATRAGIIYSTWNPTWEIISCLLEIGFVSHSRWKASSCVYLFCNLTDSLPRLRVQPGWKQILTYTFMTMFSQNWSTKHGSQKWMPYLVFLIGGSSSCSGTP